MANTNNEAMFVGDLPHITSCNTADLLVIVSFSDPANTQTASLKLISIGSLANALSILLAP